MAGGEVRLDKHTLLPRILELARTLPAARAERCSFCWAGGKWRRAAAEGDPVQMMEVMLMGKGMRLRSLQILALSWDTVTERETKVMDSVDKGKLKVTGVLDPVDMGTETGKGGKDPEDPVRAHSESHCCISGQEQEPCGRLGYPESRADHPVSQTQRPPPALN